MRKHESGNTPQIKRRSENTTTPAATVRRTGSKHFQQDNQHQINLQQITIAVEHRVVHNRVPFRCRSSVQQKFDCIIAFTVERRKKENQHTQHHTAKSKFLIRVLEFSEYPFNGVHRPCEVERNQSAEDSQQDHVRDTFQFESLVEVELEHSLRSGCDIGNSCRSHGGNQQRKQRRHRKVDHQHFQRKYQPGNRGLKDSRNRPCRATADEQHQRAVFHLENTSQIGADGRTRQHNRCLRSNRSTEADRDGTGNCRRPDIMSFDTSLTTRNRIQDLGNTMTDVILHDITHKPSRQENTDHRIYQIQIVGRCRIKVVCQKILYLMNKELQK